MNTECTGTGDTARGGLAALASADGASLTRRHLEIVLIIAAGWFWDADGISIGSVLATVFSGKPGHMSTGALSWVVASTYLGAAIGAPAFGWAADRFGRRDTLIAAILLLAASACGTSLSPSIEWLLFFRTLSGVAIGAYPIVSIPYLAEIVPARLRGRMLLIATGMGAIAVPITLLGAHFVAEWTSDSNTWRWLCAICSGGSALTAAAMLRLPESSKWLRLHQQKSDSGLAADSAAHSISEKSDRTSPRVLAPFLVLLNALAPWTTVGFPILSGAVLIDRGFSLTESFLFSGVVAFGLCFGLFASSWRIDAVQRRTMLIGCTLTIAVCLIWFTYARNPLWIVVSGTLVTSGAGVCIQMLNLYLAEMFTTRIRALGISSGSLVNRVTSFCVPLVLLPVLHSHGAMWLSAIQAGTMLASAALLRSAPTGNAGRPLD